MKILISIILFMLIANMGCRQKSPEGQEHKKLMVLDSITSDKNLTMVHPKDTMRPMESVKDLRELPNIMQNDLEETQKISSKEIRYVKLGESLRPNE